MVSPNRFLAHWELQESIREPHIELVLQKVLEKFPDHKPRIISDNGPQFLARDFKEFIRLVGATHIRTSQYYPQSNGKIERWHGSFKRECIRLICPDSVGEGAETDHGVCRTR